MNRADHCGRVAALLIALTTSLLLSTTALMMLTMATGTTSTRYHLARAQGGLDAAFLSGAFLHRLEKTSSTPGGVSSTEQQRSEMSSSADATGAAGQTISGGSLAALLDEMAARGRVQLKKSKTIRRHGSTGARGSDVLASSQTLDEALDAAEGSGGSGVSELESGRYITALEGSGGGDI